MGKIQIPKSKSQNPNPKQIPNAKFQTPKCATASRSLAALVNVLAQQVGF